MAKSVMVWLLASLVQSISGHCIGNAGRFGLVRDAVMWPENRITTAGRDMGWAGNNYGIIRNSDMDNSGALLVSSSSPLSPNGLRVMSDNTLAGDLSMMGQLPFLGAIAVNGALPTSGTAQANYGCGNGNVRIIESYGPRAGYASSNTRGLTPAAVSGFGQGAAIIAGNSGCQEIYY